MMPCKLNPHILAYIEDVEANRIQACILQHQLVAYIRKCFETEDIHVDDNLLEKYLDQVKYFPYDRLFPWEEFVLALHCCTFRADGMPRWPDLFLLIGRGAGKDGYIAFEGWCLAGPYSGLYRYDVDICANNEDQAAAPFEDIWNVLEDPTNRKRMTKHFYWNKEEIISLKSKARIKFRTNNPKGKDGLRSGIVYFNEIHQYTDYKNINVFTTGLGKKRHPRRGYMTTNGDVRDGPLDHYVARSKEILEGKMEDNGWLPFICMLDNKKEAHDPTKWEKANPSLPYRRDLSEEIAKEYRDWKDAPSQFTDFMTKRMNIPDGNPEIEVTSWDNILKTNRPIPDLTGFTGIVGVDFASITDFATVGILMKCLGIRYWISHSWICRQSKDLHRLKIPYEEWAKAGYLTIVDDVEIHPDLLAEWITKQAEKYFLKKIVIDNFRYALLTKTLRDIGFDKTEYKNVMLTRPSDIIKVIPVIDSMFANGTIIWGDNPLMRWYTNNTKKVPASANEKRISGSDQFGNYKYAKIEEKSRKTDGFFALAAAMACESELPEQASDFTDLGVFTY